MTGARPPGPARGTAVVHRGLVVLVLLGLAGAASLWGAAPAAAQVSLVSSDPEQGAVVDVVPTQVVLTFSETVSAREGAVTAVLPSGGAWPVSAEATGNRLVVTPVADPGRGTVAISWSVRSGDGHVLSGTLTFAVGEASGTASEGPSAGAGTHDPPASVVALRFASAVAAGVGLVAVLAGVALRRTTSLRPAWWLTLGATLVHLPLTDLAVTGRTLGDVTDVLVWWDGLARVSSLLLVGGCVAAAAAVSVRARARAVALATVAVVLAGGAVAAWPEAEPPDAPTAARSADLRAS